MLIDILPYFVSAGGAAAWLAAWRLRKSAADLSSATALDMMQKVYQQFILDTAVEIGQMKEEIKMLREVVESYKSTCDNCPNKKKANGLNNT